MSAALELARSALAGQDAWLVGGAVRDRLLGRDTADLDIIVDGDPGTAARSVAAQAGGAACFALSERFGAWRLIARDRSWQVDVEALRGGSVQADLALRDFTVNALAEPLAGGELIDPNGGRRDLERRRLRMVTERAFGDDPLRVLRLVRVAVELAMEIEPATRQAAADHAAALDGVAAERIFMELRRIIDAHDPVHGLSLLDSVGAAAAVLGELVDLRGVRQSRYHHLDVYDHTIEVLTQVVRIQAEPEAVLSEQHGPAVRRLLAEPLADELTRGGALRWAALLHDIAKPHTRAVLPDGRVSFMGHDQRGGELAAEILERLRTSGRLRTHVAAMVHHHLRLGFLVHEPQPLAPRTVYAYMRCCEPVEVDVTLLSVADRLATRGARAQEAIEAHLRVARAMLGDALHWHSDGPPAPPLSGDQLTRELGLAPGPVIGELLEQLTQATYAGEITRPEQALELARKLL